MCLNRKWKMNCLWSPTSTRVSLVLQQNTFWCPYFIAVKSIASSAFIPSPCNARVTPFFWNMFAFHQGKKLKYSFSFTKYCYSIWALLHFSDFWRKQNLKIEFSQGILPTFIHKRGQLQKLCVDTFSKQSIKPFSFTELKMIPRLGCTGNFWVYSASRMP